MVIPGELSLSIVEDKSDDKSDDNNGNDDDKKKIIHATLHWNGTIYYQQETFQGLREFAAFVKRQRKMTREEAWNLVSHQRMKLSDIAEKKRQHDKKQQQQKQQQQKRHWESSAGPDNKQRPASSQQSKEDEFKARAANAERAQQQQRENAARQAKAAAEAAAARKKQQAAEEKRVAEHEGLWQKFERAHDQESSPPTITLASVPVPPPSNPLCLQPGATEDEKKAALRRASLRWHPDKFTGKFGRKIAAGQSEAIHAAVTAVFQSINAQREKIS